MNWIGSDFRFEQVTYQRLTEGQGYVLVLGIPGSRELEDEHHLFCLTHLPQEVLRPHRQLGWLFFDGPDAKFEVNDYCLGTITIDRASYDADRFSQERLFPPPKDDVAYRDLLGFPWVQFPTLYLRQPEDEAGDRTKTDVKKTFERTPGRFSRR